MFIKFRELRARLFEATTCCPGRRVRQFRKIRESYRVSDADKEVVKISKKVRI